MLMCVDRKSRLMLPCELVRKSDVLAVVKSFISDASAAGFRATLGWATAASSYPTSSSTSATTRRFVASTQPATSRSRTQWSRISPSGPWRPATLLASRLFVGSRLPVSTTYRTCTAAGSSVARVYCVGGGRF